MIDTPTIVQTTARTTAIIHITIPRAQIQEVMGKGYQELMATLAAQNVQQAGPWYTHHLRMDPDVFDYELGCPVETPITPSGRVVAGELPAVRAVRTVYHGGYEGLGEAWGKLEAWAQAEGLTTRADLWEVYAAGPESGPDPAGWRTELFHPLAG